MGSCGFLPPGASGAPYSAAPLGQRPPPLPLHQGQGLDKSGDISRNHKDTEDDNKVLQLFRDGRRTRSSSKPRAPSGVHLHLELADALRMSFEALVSPALCSLAEHRGQGKPRPGSSESVRCFLALVTTLIHLRCPLTPKADFERSEQFSDRVSCLAGPAPSGTVAST